jgi:hypothetical protein
MSFRFGPGTRVWARRCTSLLVLLSMFVSFVPLPVGLPTSSAKDSSAPFPRQHRACRCHSAAQCSKCCCCSSDSERPASHTSGAADESDATRGPRQADDKDETVYVIGFLAERCQGQGPGWHALPWAVVPRLQATPVRSKPESWGRPVSAKAPERSSEPPVPPPRLVTAVTV